MEFFCFIKSPVYLKYNINYPKITLDLIVEFNGFEIQDIIAQNTDLVK